MPDPTDAAWTPANDSMRCGDAVRSIRQTQSALRPFVRLILLGPCARDDLGGALVEQLEADGAAEFAGPVRRATS